MRIEFLKSFDKSIKNLTKNDKKKIFDACQSLIDLIEQEAIGYRGLGLKHLQVNFWEIRVGIKIRVIFRWKKDNLQFILVGSHDNIKNFLKENI